MKNNNFAGLVAGLLFIVILYIIVVPIENPGMLVALHGVKSNAIFHASILKFTILELVLSSLFFFSLLYSVSSARRIPYRNNFRLIIIMFFLCIVWGYMGTFVIGKEVGLDQLGIARWKKLFYGIVLFSSLSLYADSKAKVITIINSIVLGCLLLDIFGLTRYFLFGGIEMAGIGKVVFWETAKFELNVFVIVCVLGLLLLGDQMLTKKARKLYWIAMAVAYIVVFMSSRRTSMVMVLVSTFIYVFLLAKKGYLGKAVFITSLGLMGILIVGIFNYEAVKTKLFDRLISIQAVFDPKILESDNLSKTDESTQHHMNDLTEGWEIIKENLVWGVGYTFAQEKSFGKKGYSEELYWVHNAFLTFWLRFGILGAITYLYVYMKIFLVMTKCYRESKDAVIVIFLVWFLNSFLAGLFFPPFFGFFKNTALFFGPLALANVYINLLKAEKQQVFADEGG